MVIVLKANFYFLDNCIKYKRVEEFKCLLNNWPICQGRTTLAYIICTVTVVLSRSVWKLGVNKLQKIKIKIKKNQ